MLPQKFSAATIRSFVDDAAEAVPPSATLAVATRIPATSEASIRRLPREPRRTVDKSASLIAFLSCSLVQPGESRRAAVWNENHS
jgi:hypothetical protein